MNYIPHVIPYQGSKRRLAAKILEFVSGNIYDTLYEPFAGSAAVTLAAASNKVAKRFVIGDKLGALAKLWGIIINHPGKLIIEYTKYWTEQSQSPREYYFNIRDYYNKTQSPTALFYLIARCVKNSIRFNPNGEFNQSPDNRRLGMHPIKLKGEVYRTSQLLKGKTEVISGDFSLTLNNVTPLDLVYLDPPWKGLSNNPRYAHSLDFEGLLNELARLNKLKVPFLLSFDGSCGDKDYEIVFPEELRLQRVAINAGRSSQATLLGRSDITIESLYLSPTLSEKKRKTINSFHEKEKLKQLKLLG